MKPLFYKPTLDDAETIMRWRLKPRVTRYMRTDIEDDIDAQKKWLIETNRREDYYHWLVCIGSRDLAIGFINIELLPENRATWGFYIGEDDFLNIGAFIPPYLYNHLFFKRKISILIAEVVPENVSLLKLHKMHGYKTMKIKKKAFSKNGEDFDLSVLELNSERWAQMSHYHKYQSDFDA